MYKSEGSNLEQEKYKGIYRTSSNRLKTWNYANNGCYFVTICTKNRENFLGEIVNDVQLSKLGKISKQCWEEIPMHFPFVKLDEYIVMPNHIHGIIIMSNPRNVETQNLVSLQNKFGPQSKNLASIIRGFKVGVTKIAKKNNINFYWQKGYYDHIIRNDQSLAEIRQYIIDNPKNWKKDK